MANLDPRIEGNAQRIKDLEEQIVDIQQWIGEHIRYHNIKVLPRDAEL